MKEVRVVSDGEQITRGTFSLFWRMLIYSPFVLSGFSVFMLVASTLDLHWITGLLAGCITAFALFFVVGIIHSLKEQLKNSGKKSWIPLFVINVLLIAGLPFYLGFMLSNSFFHDDGMMLLELYLINSVGGAILAFPAYFGVINKFSEVRQ